MESVEESPGEVLVQLNECLVNLQLILKCSICCSTLRDPVTPSCNHAFCKECLEGVFQRRYSIECPVCRQKITKRSARTPSEHVSALVALYLQLVQCFKADIKDSNPIPKDKFILESQALTQAAGFPLKEINLKVPEHTITKKRKNQEAISNRKKISRYNHDDENFAVPSLIRNQFKENENITDNYENARDMGAKINMPMIEEEKSSLMQNDNIDEHVINKNGTQLHAKTASSGNRSNDDEVADNVVLFKIPVCINERASKRDAKATVNEGADLYSFPDLEKVIKQRKVMDPECNNIQAFFRLFPIVHDFFKKNLHELLHEFEVGSPKERCEDNTNRSSKIIKPIARSDSECQTDSPAKRLQTRACQTDKNRVNECRMVGCQTNVRSNDGFQTIACQTEEYSTKELKNTSCQTEAASIEEDVVPASEPGLQCTVEVACQTDGLNINELSISRCPNISGVAGDSEPIVPPSDTPSRIDVNVDFRTSIQRTPTVLPNNATQSQLPPIISFDENFSDFKDFPLPPKPVIVVSRRQSAKDNDLLNLFKYKFGNVQIRTEFTNNATHLVMMNMRDNSPVKERSLIYVQSIIHRLEILSRNWIEDCVESETLLNTNNYRIEIFDYYPWFVKKSDKPPLFGGILFYLPYRYFSASDPIKREQIIQLITRSGGQITSTADDIVKVKRKIPNGLKCASKFTACLVIFSSFSKEADGARRVSYDLKTSVVSGDYILDCICENQLLPEEKYFIKS